jgi:hypothetical protein
MKTTLENAFRAVGIYAYQDKSSNPQSNAQRNLEGRTHYADEGTLRTFKSKILRSTESQSGLYFILQESLPHPELGRVRRNVLFNVQGTVTSERDNWHKSAKKADTEYTELLMWADSQSAYTALEGALRDKLTYFQRQIDDALEILNGEVTK